MDVLSMIAEDQDNATKQAVSELISKLVTNDNYKVRAHAATVLGSLGQVNDKVLAALRQVEVDQESKAVRKAAESALEDLGVE